MASWAPRLSSVSVDDAMMRGLRTTEFPPLFVCFIRVITGVAWGNTLWAALPYVQYSVCAYYPVTMRRILVESACCARIYRDELWEMKPRNAPVVTMVEPCAERPSAPPEELEAVSVSGWRAVSCEYLRIICLEHYGGFF